MLTIFTCPKPFRGHIGIIQRNAIKSWTLLRPKPEIILMCDEEGTKEICSELGLRHIPAIERSEFGTPLLSSIFSEAEKAASFQFLCYINTDIMLMSDFSLAFNSISQKIQKFLLIGYRWNIDINKTMDFIGNWQEELMSGVLVKGSIYELDCFVFTKGLFKMPAFAVGRPMWDNWLMYEVCSKGFPAIDITSRAYIIHQNHEPSPHRYSGVEVDGNIALAGGYGYSYNIANSTHKLTKNGIKRNLSFSRFYWVINRLFRRLIQSKR